MTYMYLVRRNIDFSFYIILLCFTAYNTFRTDLVAARTSPLPYSKHYGKLFLAIGHRFGVTAPTPEGGCPAAGGHGQTHLTGYG